MASTAINMIDLSGKKVLILGGAHEIAQGVAEAFRIAGARVALGTHSESTSNGFEHFQAPLHDPEVLAEELLERDFDSVIISPGWFEHGTFLSMSLADIDKALSANFEYATYAAQAAAKSLIHRKQAGSIIFLSSVAGLMPMIHTNLAGSTLAAIHVIARMAAVDLAPHQIRVNVVASGWVDKNWSQDMVRTDGFMLTPEDIPMGNAGSTQSVGDACCFLVSSLSRYITGIILPVDGGFLLTKSAAASPFRS